MEHHVRDRRGDTLIFPKPPVIAAHACIGGKILANTPQFVQLICGESGIVPAAFVAILLNCLLPRDEK